MISFMERLSSVDDPMGDVAATGEDNTCSGDECEWFEHTMP